MAAPTAPASPTPSGTSATSSGSHDDGDPTQTQTRERERAREGRRRGDGSIGELLSEVAADGQKLFRQEVELAKAEIRQEASRAGQAAGMYGGAGFAGYMVALFGTLAAVYGLANVMDAGWAALIVTGVWAVLALILYLLGRARMRQLSPMPEQTMETLKEDAEWVRHPTK